MKKFLLLVLFIFIISCNTPTGELIKEYTFEKGFEELKQIEVKYNSFHPAMPESEDDVWAMFAEINVLKNRVENLKQTNEIRALRYFLFFRSKSYESNIQLKMANNYKLMQTKGGILVCPTRAQILARVRYLDRTIEYGNESLYNLNIFLRYYPEKYALTGMLTSYPKIFEASYFQLGELLKEEVKLVTTLCSLEI